MNSIYKYVVPALSAFILGTGSAQASTPVFSTYPKSTPRLSPEVRDYTTTCNKGVVRLFSVLPPRTKAFLNGRVLRPGTHSILSKLSPGQRLHVQARYGKKNLDYSIRCIPRGFPSFKANGLLPASMPWVALASTNVGAVLGPYAIVVDRRGVPIWWKYTAGYNVMDVKGLPNGRIGFWSGLLNSDHAEGSFTVYNNKGQLQKSVATIGSLEDAHDSQLAPDGSWYRMVLNWHLDADLSSLGEPAHAVWDDQLQQIGTDGAVKWSWNALDHVSPADGLRWYGVLKATTIGTDPLDLFHLNSIEQAGQNDLIISMRHMDAVYRIRKSDGKILWKLGGATTPESLTVLNDARYPGQPFAGQHDARLQADGTLTVYDNGTGVTGRAPRATRWQIDAQAHTARLVEEITDPQATWSAAGGSARRMSDGSWIISWSHSPYIKAYSKSHKLIWNFKIAATSYRAQPIPLSYNSRAAMVSGMDFMNPIPR